MQYANGGDLQNYLKDNFRNLAWNDKKKLAFQIADGLNYLHNNDVLHKDLVSISFTYYFLGTFISFLPFFLL
jgi:serine/threonine protein kinase